MNSNAEASGCPDVPCRLLEWPLGCLCVTCRLSKWASALTHCLLDTVHLISSVDVPENTEMVSWRCSEWVGFPCRPSEVVPVSKKIVRTWNALYHAQAHLRNVSWLFDRTEIPCWLRATLFKVKKICDLVNVTDVVVCGRTCEVKRVATIAAVCMMGSAFMSWGCGRQCRPVRDGVALSIDPGSLLRGTSWLRWSLNRASSHNWVSEDKEYLPQAPSSQQILSTVWSRLTHQRTHHLQSTERSWPIQPIRWNGSSGCPKRNCRHLLEWEFLLRELNHESTSRRVSGPNKQTAKQTAKHTLLQLSCAIWRSVAHHARTNHGYIFTICQLKLKTRWTAFFNT